MNKVIAVGLIAIILITATVGYLTYETYFVSAQPPSNSTTITSTNTENSTSTSGSGLLWQSLLVTPISGNAYWINPPQAFNLMSVLFGSSTNKVADLTQVSQVSDGILANLSPSLGTISSWSLSLDETIMITTTTGTFIGYVSGNGITVDNTQVNENGASLSTGTNVYLTSTGSITASSIITEIQSAGSITTGTPYDFVVTLSNIVLTLQTSNGQIVLTTPAATTANTLTWLVQINS